MWMQVEGEETLYPGRVIIKKCKERKRLRYAQSVAVLCLGRKRNEDNFTVVQPSSHLLFWPKAWFTDSAWRPCLQNGVHAAKSE